MYSDKQFEKLGMREASFDRLEGLDGPVGFWIIAKMCELGWEPIGSNQFRRYYGPESTGPVTH